MIFAKKIIAIAVVALVVGRPCFAENAYERLKETSASWYDALVAKNLPQCINQTEISDMLAGSLGLMTASDDSGDLRRLLETSDGDKLEEIVTQMLEIQLKVGIITCK